MSGYFFVDAVIIQFKLMCIGFQMTESEDTSSPMISPCLCNGTQKYVHTSCLQQWRATSLLAMQCCNVCNYNYQTKRSKFYFILMSTEGTIAMCALIALTAVLFSGLMSYFVFEIFRFDIVQYICKDLDVTMFWRLWTSNLDSDFSPNKFCRSYTCLFIEIILLGIHAVGLYGLGVGICDEVFQNGAGILRERLQFLVLPLLWLYAMDRTGRMRVIFIFGGMLSARKIYDELTKSARRFALLIGDSVCDINNT
jgi:hypothetical protein